MPEVELCHPISQLPLTVNIFSSDIERAFTSNAIPGLEKLVDNQINKARCNGLAVKGVILVGGLGCSPFLYEYLKAKYYSNGIEIRQSEPDRTRTAICRGAILKGLMDAPLPDHAVPYYTPTITSTISRVSLGVSMSVNSISGVHKLKDRYWDEKEGMMKARNQMDWYLKKSYYILFNDIDEFYFDEANPLTETIYKHEGDNPPKRRTEAASELCTIRLNLKGCCDYEDLEDFKGAHGQVYQKLVYTSEMIPSGASTQFSIYFQGRKLRSQQVGIHYQ
ncbi:hypothetical protein BDW74DRAFT_175131 [Aspergillus multicolor]|uniref:uncharacterized protein n=1 Tax=Aspergillus multicolor TaxID=41759 RepID=UPI003CCCC8DB